jgi:hypothetical protein
MNSILLSGTRLATRRVMHRSGQVAVLSLAFIAFLVEGSQAPATTEDSTALRVTESPVPAPISQQPVRITRQLIRVPAQQPVAAPRRPHQLLHRRTAVDDPHRANVSTVASRTRRLLMGDGQYRPEPFPRLTR